MSRSDSCLNNQNRDAFFQGSFSGTLFLEVIKQAGNLWCNFEGFSRKRRSLFGMQSLISTRLRLTFLPETGNPGPKKAFINKPPVIAVGGPRGVDPSHKSTSRVLWFSLNSTVTIQSCNNLQQVFSMTSARRVMD